LYVYLLKKYKFIKKNKKIHEKKRNFEFYVEY